jgi:hypothetical protein
MEFVVHLMDIRSIYAVTANMAGASGYSTLPAIWASEIPHQGAQKGTSYIEAPLLRFMELRGRSREAYCPGEARVGDWRSDGVLSLDYRGEGFWRLLLFILWLSGSLWAPRMRSLIRVGMRGPGQSTDTRGLRRK